MKRSQATYLLVYLLIWFARICQGQAGPAAITPKFLPGAIKLMIRDDASLQQTDQLLQAYGVKPVKEDFRYNAMTIMNDRSGGIRLWRKSGEPPAPQWVELLVPFGHEQRWVDIFEKNSSVIKAASRVEYDPHLGASTADVPDEQHSAHAIPFQFTVSDTNEYVFEKVQEFLKKEFPSPSMVYPEKDLQNVLAHRIMHADHLKRRVLNSGWQCIRIDLAIVEKPGQKELSGGIDGNFAPGWTGPGGVPPQLKDYEDELLPGRERELRQFTAILSDKMEQSLR